MVALYTSFILKVVSLFSDVIKINKKMRNKRTHRAVSEVIGTILLLGMSVTLFSVVYISVLTVPYSPPTPSANIICQIDDGNIVLSHYGGRALNFDSKILLTVDGQSIDFLTAGDYLYNDFNNDGLWSMGEKVVFSYTSLVLGGEQIEVNILDTGSNSLILSGTLQEEIGSGLTISTSVDTVNPYVLTSSPFDITATGPSNLDNAKQNRTCQLLIHLLKQIWSQKQVSSLPIVGVIHAVIMMMMF
jgi:FlaG/FlaF family flagellin (archaellin)